MLSIWYANISEKLTANDGLVLASPNGDMLWNPEGLGDRVSCGVFNDIGNSVLEDGELNSLWETFKFSSDAFLPSQVVERLKETNFSKGRCEILLQNDGNLVMFFVNLTFGYVDENENYYESVKLWIQFWNSISL